LEKRVSFLAPQNAAFIATAVLVAAIPALQRRAVVVSRRLILIAFAVDGTAATGSSA
jgi:hypothetical protein